jgi:peptidoglycan/LPS O-acetylase OafA/YrhL
MGVFRLFLALSVLLGHTRGHGFFGLSFVFPEIAVQSFFMISGFYMALVLNEKYNQPGQYLLFLRQRFLRLYPTYLILLIGVLLIDSTISAVLGSPWGSLKIWQDNFHLLSPVSFAVMAFENAVIFGQDVMMVLFMDPANGAFHVLSPTGAGKYLNVSDFLLISPSWSLAVEFSFYLLAPLLVRRPLRAQLVIFALGIALRAAFYFAAPDGRLWSYSLFPPNLFFFMAGSLAYIFYKNYQPQLRAIALSKPWIIVLFAALALDYCRFPFTRQLYLIWMPLVFVMVPMLFALTNRSRVDRFIGELSYPCYLIHPHVLMFTRPLFSLPDKQWLLGPVSFALTLVLSFLFYRFIEMKTERFRENLYRKSRPAQAGPTPAEAAGLQTTAPTLH